MSGAGALGPAYLIQAAREAGVRSIVTMSQFSARREAKSHAAQDHWLAERLLDLSGLKVTHIRPACFAEWLIYDDSVKKQDRIIPPFGKGRPRLRPGSWAARLPMRPSASKPTSGWPPKRATTRTSFSTSRG